MQQRESVTISDLFSGLQQAAVVPQSELRLIAIELKGCELEQKRE
jgi:hypothetical protein